MRQSTLDPLFELTEILDQFDKKIEPVEDRDVQIEVSKLRKREIDAGLGFPIESVAECAAFMFCPEYHWKEDGWETYYGPMYMYGSPDEGKTVFTPDIHQFDIKTFNYWEKRARDAKHPVLRIRYADLCWEFQKRITGVAPSIEMANIVIDATIDATFRRLVKHNVNGRKKLARALRVAIAIGDTKRIGTLRDAIVSYEDLVARDDAPGLWGFSFDLILENKKIPRSPELELKVITDLENRLARLGTLADGKPMDAWGAEYAALRLAAYYRRLNKQEDVRRVLILYGNAFEGLAQSASGLQAAGWLQRVHGHYHEYGLRGEAESLLLKVREHAKKSNDEMGVHSQKIQIPKEEMDRFLDGITRGDLTESLHRFAIEFLADKNQAIDQINQIKENAPLMSMISFLIVDHEGRPSSQIGSVDDDLDGRIIYQISQIMRYSNMFIFLAIDRIREKFSPSVEDMLNHLILSPIFSVDNIEMLRAGLKAYLQNDHIAAGHLLVPQIEAALRRLLDKCGGNLWKPHRGGGLMLKNLEDLLREETVIKSLTEDGVLTFRALLTDQRGWNLRNGICHGILTTESFGRGMNDRLLHLLLVLATMRTSFNDEQKSDK